MIAAMDRTNEDGAMNPLYLDVIGTLHQGGRLELLSPGDLGHDIEFSKIVARKTQLGRVHQGR